MLSHLKLVNIFYKEFGDENKNIVRIAHAVQWVTLWQLLAWHMFQHQSASEWVPSVSQWQCHLLSCVHSLLQVEILVSSGRLILHLYHLISSAVLLIWPFTDFHWIVEANFTSHQNNFLVMMMRFMSNFPYPDIHLMVMMMRLCIFPK